MGEMSVQEQESIRSGLAWLVSRHKGLKNALAELEFHVEKVGDIDDRLMDSLCWTLAKAGVPTIFSVDVLSLLFKEQTDRDTVVLYVTSGWERANGEADQSAKHNYAVMSPSALKNLAPGMSIEKVAAVVARHDKRLSEMVFCDSRNGSMCWDSKDTERIAKFCTFLGIDLPDESFGNRRFLELHAMKIIEWIDTVYHNHGMKSWREITGWIISSLRQINPLTTMLKTCADEADSVNPLTLEERNELLDTWLLKAFPGLPDSQLIRTYSRKWILGGIARAVDPGVFIKAMLVIVSKHHSAGKTSLLRALAGDFYLSVKQGNLNDKDAQMLCHYAWLQEFEEMAAFNKSDIEHVKAYITTQEDKFRPPFGRAVISSPRPCFYAGSANSTELLRDPTGSVRFWCVELPEGCYADFKWFHDNRVKLLGAAYRTWEEAKQLKVAEDGAAERASERAARIDELLNLSRADIDSLEEANKNFRVLDALEATVTEAAYKAAITRADGTPVLPLRCSWEDLAAYLGRPDYQGRVNVASELSYGNQARWKKILLEAGWVYTRKRIRRDGSTISDVSGMLWFAPADCEERYKNDPPMLSRGDNVIELKIVTNSLTG